MRSGDLRSVEECIRIGSYWSDWKEDASLLTVAIKKGYEDIALALLAAQTLSLEDVRGALDVVSKKGREGVMQKLTNRLKCLLQEQTSYEESKGLWQEQMNDMFRHAILDGNWVLVRDLLENGYCTSSLSTEEQEMLFLHAFNKSGSFVGDVGVIIGALLQNGVVMHTVSILSSTQQQHLLHLACDVNALTVADALITNGCNVNYADKNKHTPLMFAAHRGHEELMKKLLLANAKVGMQDAYGATALHHAARKDHIQCGILLVEGGASIKTKDIHSQTPLDVAYSSEFRKAIKEAESFTTRKIVCIIGNAEGGKSTLIAALQAESSSFFGKTINRFRKVDDHLKRTTGIDTIPHGSQKYGEVLFFDFAGQHEYHGPHQVFLESLLSKPGVSMTLLLVVKATEVEDAILHQLHRWLSPLAMAITTASPPQVIVVSSFLDKVQSKQEATIKLTRCIEATRKDLEKLPLEFVGSCLLDCRQPQSEGMDQLCCFLKEAPIPDFRATHTQYSLAWVLSQIRTTQMAVQLQEFSKWIQDNQHNLPKTMPPPEEVCQDLSAAGHALYIPNKEEPLKSWLVLDLPSILHDVYGALFSQSKENTTEFGLLHSCHLVSLFPDLDVDLVQQLLVSLEFCIPVDPSVLKVEISTLMQSEEASGWLFFPALISTKPPQLCLGGPAQQSGKYLCWQLWSSKKHSISADVLQTILLRLAAHFVVQQCGEEGVQDHCCSIWWNGIAWQSKGGVDISVHIANNRVIQVVGMSNMLVAESYQYLSDVISDILSTVRQLCPNLAAAAYIVHPPKMAFVHEAATNVHPKELFLLEDVRNSIIYHKAFTLSRKDSFGYSTKLPVPDLFGGLKPSLEDIERILWKRLGQTASRLQSPTEWSKPNPTVVSTYPPPAHTAPTDPLPIPTAASLHPSSSTPTAASTDSLPTPAAAPGDPQRPHAASTNPVSTPTAASADPPSITAELHPSFPSGAQALLDPSSVPALSDINELIVTPVAANWQNLALVLGVKGFLLDIVTRNHPNDCEGACRDMLNRWLRKDQHTGEEKRIWSTLLTALGRADFRELERSIREEHFYN